ncbi:MAG: cytidine deaminase [Pirellulaceae bacterium]|nr:cytidine deaminase [Pirellulaceae bacterium]
MIQSDQVTQQLVQRALQVRRRAYAPYSNFLVGAALLGSDGQIYAGCNVENASFGLSICAERVAIATMVASGCQQIQAMAIALLGDGSPCGACRQVLAEFGTAFPVFLVDATDNQLRHHWLSDQLLPDAFRLKTNG